MKCPVCKDVTLLMSEKRGVEIDYCPECRGIWLDRGELEKLIEEKTNITKELEDIKEKEQTKKSYEEIKNLSKVWTHLEFKEKRTIIEGLLDKIVVDGNTLKIYWNVSEN